MAFEILALVQDLHCQFLELSSSCTFCSQAWAVLEYKAGNIALARSMHGCAVKADPDSGTAWEVRLTVLVSNEIRSL